MHLSCSGGRPWLRRTQRLIDDMCTEPRLTRRIRAEVLHLRDLLQLEHVDDMERPEAGYFAEIDPDATYVSEICLLTEALADAIAGTNTDAPEKNCEYKEVK